MDERDAQFSPPPELESLDAWLRRDGERWRVRVPSNDALVNQARALAMLAPTPAAPPRRPQGGGGHSGGSSNPPTGAPRRRRRFATVLAAIAAVLIVGLMLAVVHGATGPGTGVGTGTAPTATVPPAPTQPATPIPTATLSPSPTTAATATATPKPGPFTVTSVSITINPTDISGTRCGTYFTETYTATFHLASNGPGGTIQFEYTVNNGRGSNLASITVSPGQTTATYQFTWAGNLPPDHTAPEGGGVVVHSPNNVTSQLVGPTGRCS